MRGFGKRLLVASVLSTSLFACSEGGQRALGPAETALDPVTVARPSFSITADVEGCLATWDISTTEPGADSPCDAAHGENGFPGVYFMPSLVGNPNVSGELLSGLANDLIFEVVPFACSGTGCETKRLQVREKGGVYAASWTINKKDTNLAETYWRVRVSLDAGAGNDPVPLAYRDVFQTNSPSTDQPSDGPTLDIQFGSTQSVKIFIDRQVCTNVEQGTSIRCLIGDDGGSLGLITPTGQQVELNIGPGNGSRAYTLATNPGAVDVDVRLIGDAVTVTADPPFSATERLNASDIRFCEPSEFDTSGSNAPFVIQQDEHGQSVLPGIDVSCPLFSTSVGLLDGLGDRLATFASLFAPREVIATAAVARGSGGGGTLQRLSDFQLAEMPSASIESGASQTITAGETVDASVKVEVSDGSAAAGATIHFFAEAGDVLTCSSGSTGTSCVELTGADGLASVGWMPATGSRTLYALGCGIAVAGEDTPQTATDGILGVLQSTNGGICDRDPSVVDGYDSSVDGYANGAGSGVDPFEPYNDTEIAINDLPLVFTATVEAPYTVIDGRSDATDGFGVRFRSFGNRGDSEVWLGVGDLESVSDRVEADLSWLKDAAVGDRILLSYDPAGAPGGRLLAHVDVPGGDKVTLTYDDVEGTAPAACPAAAVEVLVIEIVGRHKATMIDLRNTEVNGIPIEPGSFSGTRGTFNWTIEGFDLTDAFTVTGDLFLSGEFPPNGDALTKLQISAACLP